LRPLHRSVGTNSGRGNEKAVMILYLLGKEIIFVTVTALISLSALESLLYDSGSSALRSLYKQNENMHSQIEVSDLPYKSSYEFAFFFFSNLAIVRQRK
jgi:hypothetical protein